MTQLSSTPEYSRWLQTLKEKIKQTQVRADLAASRELKRFYEFFSYFSDTDLIVPRVGAQLKNEKVPRPGTKQVCLHVRGEAVLKPEEVFGSFSEVLEAATRIGTGATRIWITAP